ncbi:MAG TPA: 2-dehydropantoate 2-reductase N-terminal domain-containing protein [Bacteroidales bacterium]|nr:2-dehydropantoate 2-reductase N-terminal domain-containing protein [Bacteroidales bacterium]
MSDLMETRKVFFVGAGAIATAMGNVLSRKDNMDVTLITIEKEVADAINTEHINRKYFPNLSLEQNLKASTDFSLLAQESLVFIAIPSVVAVNFLTNQIIHPKSIIVNLAKGFGNGHQTIVELLTRQLPNPVCALKGPSFAREIINNQPTAFTLGAADPQLFSIFQQVFRNTSLYIDFTTDIRGVEILSILKNIYAIAIGVVDAQFESPNLKFMIFTKALSEMRHLLLIFGGKKKTLFNYCGIGDFALTALNDLSRNRTLGLLIGKGFFTDNISEKVVLEGRIAVNIFYKELEEKGIEPDEYPILDELYKVFNQSYDISSFVINLLKNQSI